MIILKNIDAIKEYKQFLLVEKGLSKQTIDNYIRDIQHFIDYVQNKFNIYVINDINKDHIYLYLKDLHTQLKESSIQRHMVALRQFYIFLVKEKITEKNIMSQFDMGKKGLYLPEVLNLEEINQLLDSINVTDAISSRNRCMVELLYSSGLRVSELCYLSLSDINIQKRFVKCLGKGNKQRTIPMNTTVCQFLTEYIEIYRPQLCSESQTSYLFIDKKGNPIKRDNFYHILEKIVKNSGITKHVTPHTLRHTFATHLLENDADLRAIQEMLGHSNISTTTIYTHISQKKKMKEYKRAHIRSRKGVRK